MPKYRLFGDRLHEFQICIWLLLLLLFILLKVLEDIIIPDCLCLRFVYFLGKELLGLLTREGRSCENLFINFIIHYSLRYIGVLDKEIKCCVSTIFLIGQCVESLSDI